MKELKFIGNSLYSETKRGIIRVNPKTGNPIPRIRLSKKERLKLRKLVLKRK